MASQDPYYNRRTKGTRLYAIRNRIAMSILAAGGLLGLGFHYLPTSQRFSEMAVEKLSHDSEFIQEKRFRLAHKLPTDSSTVIRDRVKKSEDVPAA